MGPSSHLHGHDTSVRSTRRLSEAVLVFITWKSLVSYCILF
jgi:hypothetical protein